MRGAGVRREEKMVSECRMDVLRWGRVGYCCCYCCGVAMEIVMEKGKEKKLLYCCAENSELSE